VFTDADFVPFEPPERPLGLLGVRTLLRNYIETIPRFAYKQGVTRIRTRLSDRSLCGRSSEITTALFLLAVRRRTACLHWRRIRDDRGYGYSGHVGARFLFSVGYWTPTTASGESDLTSERGHAVADFKSLKIIDGPGEHKPAVHFGAGRRHRHGSGGWSENALTKNVR
jgi:hypothetical protein